MKCSNFGESFKNMDQTDHLDYKKTERFFLACTTKYYKFCTSHKDTTSHKVHYKIEKMNESKDVAR